MKKILAITALLLLIGCNGTTPEPTDQPVVEPTSVTPAPTPTETAVATEPQPAPEPTEAPPTPLPAVTPWPLAADLYYLNDVGQIWRQSYLGDESAVARITPLDTFVSDFHVAPGGDWVAYRSEGTVILTSVDGRAGQVIAQDTGEPPGSGQTLVWSPDGSRVAYTTNAGFQMYDFGAGGGFTPIVFDAAEEPLVDLQWSVDSRWLLVTRVDGRSALYTADPGLGLWAELDQLNGAVWLPDGRIAFAPQGGGLALLDPGDLGSRIFLVPPQRTISLPTLARDGQLRFFVHEGGLETPGFLHMANPSDLSFSPESAFPVEPMGWAWNPTGDRLVRIGDDTTIQLLNPLNGAPASFTGSGTPLSLRWSDPPLEAVTGADLPTDLFFLAGQAGIDQVWRLPADGGAAEPLTNANSDVIDYTVSREGTQILYSSDGVLYRQPVGVGSPEDLITLTEETAAASPSWSPDGSRFAYSDGGIWLYDLETGQPRRLLFDRTEIITGSERQVERYLRPSWSPDGRWLLIQVAFFEGYDLALLGVPEPGQFTQPIPLNAFNASAIWLDDGRLVVFGQGGVGGDPEVAVITPPETFSGTAERNQLAALPVLDATQRNDGLLALLRLPAPFGIGPTSVRLFTTPVDGSSLPEAQTRAYVINRPNLAPDASTAAGLANIRFNSEGQRSGQIEILDLDTGEAVLIADIFDARDLSWLGEP
ncbi:MAG: hypothetical protein GYB64_01080 [Chloroflexi bacterium]|nr:hypothetical protein [Chloroflexota bacterium]